MAALTTTEPLSATREAEIRDREQAATPGPWEWHGNKERRDIELRSTAGLKYRVMSFWRWGMRGATPYFLHADKGSVEPPPFVAVKPHHGWDIIGIDHPDARFIEHAREDIALLLAEIDRLRAEAGQ